MSGVDVVIRGGTLYDGEGGPPVAGDVAILDDRIVAVGDVPRALGATEIDARGHAVAPGFINMMSWSCESLIADERSQSEVRQGVTLEVMGEGMSMGPLTESMKVDLAERGVLNLLSPNVRYEVEWTTLGEYLRWLEHRGVSPNVASFVGSSTVRAHVVGYDDRPATADELERMCELVRHAMREGAVGLSSALIYPPATYSSTDELVALAAAAAEHDGLYASHVRSEAETLLPAIDELLDIAARAQIRAEIYHLKACGRRNWHKIGEAIAMVEAARRRGLQISADMYPYDFCGTGLDACIPPWAHDGGFDALLRRLREESTRERIREEMQAPSETWENMYADTGPERILLSGFREPRLQQLSGSSLAAVAAERGTPPEDALMDLIVEDESHVFTMYFSMSEENVRRQLTVPWVSVCSGAESQAPEGAFLETNPHPRAYGAFARVLGRYVRDERIVPLEEAIRRMTSLPATNLRLEGRGRLRPRHHADVVVFDPDEIRDHATPEQPHRYATGMRHVLVNGIQVLADGEHTGATPGRFVRGPGARP